MHNGAVEEVIARCLLDASFAETLRLAPDRALQPYSFDSKTRQKIESADFNKILRFAGFINKVQHNHLWEFFPATRKLLCYYGIELEVFTAYKLLSSEQKTGSLDEKTVRFLDFLEQYLADKTDRYPGLSAIITHERSVWEISTAAVTPTSEDVVPNDQLSEISWKAFQKLVPVINGPLRICTFQCDPGKVVDELKQGTFCGRVELTRPALFAYRLDRQRRSVMMMKPDHLTVDLLSRIDGKRSVTAVIASARREGLSEVPPLGFRQFFEQASRSEHIHLFAKKG